MTSSLGIFLIPLCILAICNQSTNAQAIQRPAVRACAALDSGLQHTLIPHTPEGSAAAPGKYPYMALIGHQKENETVVFPCSGALIDKRFVLTSAHCLVRPKASIVRLGITNLDDLAQSSGMVERKIKAIHVHPEYSAFFAYNDIGLVELESDVNYSTLVYPICLYTAAAIPLNNTELYATRLDANGRIVGAVHTRIVPILLCRDAYSKFVDRLITDGIRITQLCAQNVNQQGENCNSISANGPMVLVEDGLNQYPLVGIDSLGVRCSPHMPDVLTRVSEYLDFIESIVWPSK